MKRVGHLLPVCALALVLVRVAVIFDAPGRRGGSGVAPTEAPAAPVQPGQTYPSGLPWSSGVASADSTAFAAWRGRRVDNVTTEPNRETWEVLANPDVYGAISTAADAPRLTIDNAMLPEQEQASFAECATGAYDGYFRQIGTSLVRAGRPDTVVRLGWEANGNWYRWAIGDDVENYKACFRRQVAAMRSAAPELRIDWNMNKESFMSRSVADAYPGDDMVDIVGVDFYDMYPAYPDRAAWDAGFRSTQNGGPRGLGTWLEFAKAHGKRLSVPEWG